MGEILSNVKASKNGLNRIIAGVMERESISAENWMKVNAPWKDQTSNARNGLGCRYQGEGDSHSMTFFHSVPYGLWLEVRFEGRYAIIGPAVQEYGPRVMGSLGGTLSKLPGGH